MNANSKQLFGIGLLVGSLLLLPAGFGLAQTEAPEAQERERPEITSTTQEVVAAIKRRAQQILEARRQARRLRFSGEASQLVGYESNPSNGTSHVGDTYFENSTYLSLSKKVTPTLTWQSSFNGSFTNYAEYGDGDYLSLTGTPMKFTWQPGRMWRLDAGLDYNYTLYPTADPSTYQEAKPSWGIRQNLWGSWFHSFRHEFYVRQYLMKKSRDGAGVNTRDDRIDTRHRIRYEVGTTWKEALLKVRQEWYWLDSNDMRNDFYDATDYKLTASANRPLTEKLTVNASYAFERKNYSNRTVSLTPAEDRYDDTQTWTLSGTYDINKTWSFNPSFTYKFLNSNEPTGEYIDTTISGTLTARF